MVRNVAHIISNIVTYLLYLYYIFRIAIPMSLRGLPRWLSGNESACHCKRCRFDPWVKNIPWRSKWQPILVFLPGKSHRQRSLAGYSPWDSKESDMIERLNNNNKSPFLSPLPHTVPRCSHTELLTCMPRALGTLKSPCFANAYPRPRRSSCLLCLVQILQPPNTPWYFMSYEKP